MASSAAHSSPAQPAGHINQRTGHQTHTTFNIYQVKTSEMTNGCDQFTSCFNYNHLLQIQVTSLFQYMCSNFLAPLLKTLSGISNFTLYLLPVCVDSIITPKQ